MPLPTELRPDGSEDWGADLPLPDVQPVTRENTLEELLARIEVQRELIVKQRLQLEELKETHNGQMSRKNQELEAIKAAADSARRFIIDVGYYNHYTSSCTEHGWKYL